MKNWFDQKSFEDPAKFRGFLMALIAAVSSGGLWLFGGELDPTVQNSVVTVGVAVFVWLTGKAVASGDNGSVRPALHAQKLKEAHDSSWSMGHVVGENEAHRRMAEFQRDGEEASRQAYQAWLAEQT